MTKSVSIGFVILFFLSCADSKSQTDFTGLRERMVETQIVSRGVSDKNVIEAMLKVERHLFVPERIISMAYFDMPLSIGEGQTISQPYIVAVMTEFLSPGPQMKVLEIGTGSGYQTAILAEIVEEVFTVEIIEPLGRRSKQLLNKMDYKNIFFRIGDGYDGWKEHAPYDAIIVCCAPDEIPDPLKNQLAEGGRMIIPVGGSEIQFLVLLEKKRGKLKQQRVLPVRFVPMLGKSMKKQETAPN